MLLLASVLALLGATQAQQLFEVAVGETGLTFSPESLQASAGDRVMFIFYPRNHSVVQSTFDQPCVRKPINGSAPAGIFSGFMPTTANASLLSTYTILINDTKPLWFYCSQGQHCKNGMSMVINPPQSTEKTLINYKAAAAQELVTPATIAAATNGTGSDNSIVRAPDQTSPQSNINGTSVVVSDSGARKLTLTIGSILIVMAMVL